MLLTKFFRFGFLTDRTTSFRTMFPAAVWTAQKHSSRNSWTICFCDIRQSTTKRFWEYPSRSMCAADRCSLSLRMKSRAAHFHCLAENAKARSLLKSRQKLQCLKQRHTTRKSHRLRSPRSIRFRQPILSSQGRIRCLFLNPIIGISARSSVPLRFNSLPQPEEFLWGKTVVNGLFPQDSKTHTSNNALNARSILNISSNREGKTAKFPETVNIKDDKRQQDRPRQYILNTPNAQRLSGPFSRSKDTPIPISARSRNILQADSLLIRTGISDT